MIEISCILILNQGFFQIIEAQTLDVFLKFLHMHQNLLSWIRTKDEYSPSVIYLSNIFYNCFAFLCKLF